jgi:phage anti-repressor protein
MDELMEIQYKQIGDEDSIPSVDARELWERLEVKTPFHKWITRRIEEAQLSEEQDFASLDNFVHREIGATVKKEYTLSMDAAKHIAMLERSEKGKQVRQYFITFEKKAKQELQKGIPVPNLLPTPEETAAGILSGWMRASREMRVPEHYALTEATKAARLRTGVDYSPLLLAAPAQDNINKEEEMFLEVTEIGKRLEMSGQAVNEFLESQGLQWKEGKVWEATDEGKRHSQAHHWVAGNKSGYNLKWKFTFVKNIWIKAGRPRKKKKSKKNKAKTQAGQKAFFQ